ncbi:MAG TPA: maltose ABC transporter substrate-binding protein [Trueperaceae bacterium]|nr:maltose ABC transporter substrate-binding protein [Trueperaceae bacterium]
MKKILVSLLVVLAASGAAFGQGLTVWTTFQDQSLDWLRAEAASFTQGFGIEVNIVRLDVNELKQQALLSAPQGEAGDVFVGVPHDQIGEMAVGGVLADMTSYATASYLADLSEQARLGYTVNGRLFGLPMFVEGPALVVNNDLVPNLPATYEATMELAQQLTTADTFGFMHDINNFYFSYGWIHTYGGYVFGRDASGSLVPTDVGLDNEGAVAGAQALKDLRFAYGLIPAGTSFDVANGLFVDGALAMIYTGPWSISQYRDAGLDVSVMPVPPLANGTPFSGFMGVQGALVNQFSNLKVESANFAKWLTRSSAQVSLARLSGRIPASVSALSEVTDDPIIAGFGAALLNAEPMPNIPEMGAVWSPVGNALTVMTDSEGSDPAALLKQAVDEILGR